MPQAPELVNILLFFAPGVLLVQTLYLGGIGRGLSGFQKVVWSAIASVPIRWGGTQLVGLLDLGIEPGLELEVFLLGLALSVGVIVSLAKRAFIFLFVFGGEEEEQA
nr:hypothetical protein [Anaerolineae bacterium]